jgi:hypothetical protein
MSAPVGEAKISPVVLPGQFLSSDRSNGNGHLITYFAVWRNRAEGDVRPYLDAGSLLIQLLGAARDAGYGRNWR